MQAMHNQGKKMEDEAGMLPTFLPLNKESISSVVTDLASG